MTVLEYLVYQERATPGFWFGCSKGNGLWISFPGYNHQSLETINKYLRVEYKLKYDFELGIQKFDKVCGKTFVYFKDVYNHGGNNE